MTLGFAQWVIVAVAALRAAELILAHYNTKRLLERGGKEYGRRHYPLFVLLHGSWLIGLWIAIPPETPPNDPLLLLFVLLQAGRAWVICSLGPYWTTRVISAPDFPRIRRGPFRWVDHPNYMIVSAEIAVLPLAFSAWEIALGFSLLNGALLWWRIRIEAQALNERREPHTEIAC